MAGAVPAPLRCPHAASARGGGAGHCGPAALPHGQPRGGRRGAGAAARWEWGRRPAGRLLEGGCLSARGGAGCGAGGCRGCRRRAACGLLAERVPREAELAGRRLERLRCCRAKRLTPTGGRRRTETWLGLFVSCAGQVVPLCAPALRRKYCVVRTTDVLHRIWFPNLICKLYFSLSVFLFHLRGWHARSTWWGVEKAHQAAAIYHGCSSFHKLQLNDMLFHPGTLFPWRGKLPVCPFVGVFHLEAFKRILSAIGPLQLCVSCG